MAKIIINDRYGTTPNDLLNNNKISFKAKGIYAYIQSKPEDWDFSADRIANDTSEGITAIYTGLKELEEFGYLQRKQYKNEKGQWEHNYILYAKPENPTLENPRTGKLRSNKERYTKKDIQIKTNTYSAKAENGIYKSYLNDISVSEVDRLSSKYKCGKDQVREEASAMLLWIEGYRKKIPNYRSAFELRLAKRFGIRKKDPLAV